MTRYNILFDYPKDKVEKYSTQEIKDGIKEVQNELISDTIFLIANLILFTATDIGFIFSGHNLLLGMTILHFGLTVIFLMTHIRHKQVIENYKLILEIRDQGDK